MCMQRNLFMETILFMYIHHSYCLTIELVKLQLIILSLQQNQKKKDITEELEIAILKMCQCMNELQREVSTVQCNL